MNSSGSFSGPFSGIKVFTATTARRREGLGDEVTDWLYNNPECKPVEAKVFQSSDQSHHCLSIVLYYDDRASA